MQLLLFFIFKFLERTGCYFVNFKVGTPRFVLVECDSVALQLSTP